MRKVYADKTTRLQRTRKKRICRYAFKSIIGLIIIVILTIICANKNNTTEICYKENSTVDYKVYLKENEFYDNKYVEKDNQYIASLIDYITANFNYELAILSENIEYDYSYKVEAEVNVEEKNTDKSIYNFKEQLIEQKDFSHDSNSDLKINEKIEIDYNKYNDIIKKFVSIYELDNVESTLIVNMYINIDGRDTEFSRTKDDEYIISLEIPLTTKTIAINLDSNLIGCEEVLINCETKKFCWIKIIIGFVIILEIISIFELIKYMLKSRTAQDIYKLELKKILNNYGSYIQKINSGIDLSKYQIVWLDVFNDMLEIRDTIQQPILMFEVQDQTRTYFMIPSKTDMMYVFELKVNDEK